MSPRAVGFFFLNKKSLDLNGCIGSVRPMGNIFPVPNHEYSLWLFPKPVSSERISLIYKDLLSFDL